MERELKQHFLTDEEIGDARTQLRNGIKIALASLPPEQYPLHPRVAAARRASQD